jgi:hypothetical protein
VRHHLSFFFFVVALLLRQKSWINSGSLIDLNLCRSRKLFDKF